MLLHCRSRASCAARRAFQLSSQDKEVSFAPGAAPEQLPGVSRPAAMKWGGFKGSMGQMGEFGPRFLLLNSAVSLEVSS